MRMQQSCSKKKMKMAPLPTIPENEEYVADVTDHGTHLDHDDGREKNGVRDKPGGARRKKKHDRRQVKIVAATQNMRGLTTEADREEIRLQMERQGIHLICGQETWLRADQSQQRWDTEELFLNCGGTNTKKHDGVCFFLSPVAAKMFERGGRRLVKYCSRLATIRLQMKGGGDLYVINAHAPDSGKNSATREAFQRRLERALRATKTKDVLLLMGDFNASMGIADDDSGDGVLGMHGISHVNKAGQELEMLAAAHGLKDLVSQEEQAFYGTWMHPQSKKWHQLDKIFMRGSQSHMVNKCTNGEMLKVSDHYSVRLNVTLTALPKPPITSRQKNNSRDLQAHFANAANEEMRRDKV